MYEYLIQDEHGKIVFITEDRHHAKAVAEVLQDRHNKPYFVDCMLANTNGLCDYMPISTVRDVPDRREDQP